MTESFEHDYSVIDHVDGKLLVLTNNGAPNYRLIAIDPAKPDESHWQTILPEKKEVLQWVNLMNGTLVAGYLSDVSSTVKIYGLAGNHMSDIPLPGLGIVGGFSSRNNETEGFFSFTSFTDPGTTYRYDAKAGTYKEFRKSPNGLQRREL